MIEWSKYILSILPLTLRRMGIYSLFRVMISPIVLLYNAYLSWRQSQIVKQAGSPQVIMLKKLVYDKLGLVIDIMEDTGKPNDFIVQTDTTDVNVQRRLYALIQSYKLAGKSFTFANQAVQFIQSWSDYVCETLAITQTWGGYVCEALPRSICTVNITVDRVDDSETRIIVFANQFPADIYLDIVVEYNDEVTVGETIHYSKLSGEGVVSEYYYYGTRPGENVIDVVINEASDPVYEYNKVISFM